MKGVPLSARQKYVLRWLHVHDTHYASWCDEPGYIVIRGRRCSISVAESDWRALGRFVMGLPVPAKIFGPTEQGIALANA